VFYLCCHCDRGQRYCSTHCREKARRLQRREANRRHQQSLEGRLDHRDRQRLYRRRLKRRYRKARVTDPSSPDIFPCAKLSGPPDFLPMPETERVSGWVACHICGRRGRWIQHFPEGKYDLR